MDIKGIEKDSRLYKIWDAAQVLGLQPKTLRRKIKDGHVPGVVMGSGRGLRYYMTGSQIYEQIECGLIESEGHAQ